MIACITLIRPMSAAIVWGSKRIENRPRDLPKKMRGVPTIVAVHAGRKWDDEYVRTVSDIDGVIHVDFAESVPYADRFNDEGLVGLMLLSGRVFTAESPPPMVPYPAPFRAMHPDRWFSGPYGYEILAAVPFEKPLPCRGSLGWWPVPDEHEPVVRATDGWHDLETQRDGILRAA